MRKTYGKITPKEQSCTRQCHSNCCNELFLKVNNDQILTFKNKSVIYAEKDWTDWKWLKLHEGITVDKLENKFIVSIDPSLTFKITFNPIEKTDYLIIVSKCKWLLPNNLCKAYRCRPIACRTSECVWNSKKLQLKWIEENTILKKGDNHGYEM